MGNSSKKSKILLVVLLIIIVLLVLYYISFRPFLNDMSSINAQITSVKEEIASLSTKTQLIADSKKQLEELQTEVAEIEGDVLSFGDYAQYLSDFQDTTANASGTSILFVEEITSPSGGYTIVKSNVKLMCNYDSLKFILRDMFRNHIHCYDLKVNAIYNNVSDGSITTMLDVSFTADYFSHIGSYTPGGYDFVSGNYGLSTLFGGVVSGDGTQVQQPENQPEQNETEQTVES